MRFGIRTPSLKRRISARTSWKRYIRHSIGLKAPRGMGIFINPKRALYNKVYNKTSVSVDRLFTTKGTHKPLVNTSSSKGFSSSFLINTVIFFVLLFLFFPLGIAFLIYKLYKAGKNNRIGENNTQETTQSNSNLSAMQGNSSFAVQFHISEPTKSLLWITDEDTSKISSPYKLTVNLSVKDGKVEADTRDDSYSFYSEPSLIWTRLPVEQNNELETEKMYYPTYFGLSPRHRYQYLSWLRDVTKETNLSYVFLYYYGLERQLLVGNYDLAVDEILRLIKYHDKGTFKGYAINALVLGSGYRKRPEIIKKAPFILDEPTDISLYLQRLANDPLTAEEIMSLASRVGFTNKRYINEFPDLFKQELQKVIDTYQEKNGDLLQVIDIEKLPKDSWASMANTSIPDEIRTSKFPDILNGSSLKTTLKELLQEAHLGVKALKTKKRD